MDDAEHIRFIQHERDMLLEASVGFGGLLVDGFTEDAIVTFYKTLILEAMIIGYGFQEGNTLDKS